MGRVMAFDYGTKRVGMAVTDPSGIIATALDTVMVHEVFPYITGYLKSEVVTGFVVGKPLQTNGSPSEITPEVERFVARLKRDFPDIPVYRIDERYTSVIAHRSMIESGLKKKDRADKALVDQVSAVLILQSWMETKTS